MPIDASQIFAYATDLRNSGSKLRREVGKVVQSSGRDLEAAAKAAAPERTGALRASITKTGSGLTAKVGTDLRYAQFQEYGTSVMPPQPFMSPAVDATEGKFYSAVEEAAGRVLDI